MPTYEYRCEECDEVWDRSEHIEEHEKVTAHEASHPKCPRCGGERVHQEFTAFFARTTRKS